MDDSILDLKKQMPDIVRALKRRERVVVSYDGGSLAVIQPISEMKVENLRANPLFGIWKDRKDLEDPDAVVRSWRKGRDYVI